MQAQSAKNPIKSGHNSLKAKDRGTL